MNPNDYEGSLEQAEYACFQELTNLLELQEGISATIGFPLGFPDSMTWRIAALGAGDTMTFPASAHYFRGRLDLYNRDRAALQRWIMRLVSHFPVHHAYNSDNPTRADANIVHFRISPERNAIGDITTTTVETSNSGPVPTWTVAILFDVVFIADPDSNNGEGNEGGNTGGTHHSTDEHGQPTGGGGYTGGGEIPD